MSVIVTQSWLKAINLLKRVNSEHFFIPENRHIIDLSFITATAVEVVLVLAIIMTFTQDAF